jgi:hypothetical protein
MPGSGLVMEGAMQQAPQPARQGMALEGEGGAANMVALSAAVAHRHSPA